MWTIIHDIICRFSINFDYTLNKIINWAFFKMRNRKFGPKSKPVSITRMRRVNSGLNLQLELSNLVFFCSSKFWSLHGFNHMIANGEEDQVQYNCPNLQWTPQHRPRCLPRFQTSPVISSSPSFSLQRYML